MESSKQTTFVVAWGTVWGGITLVGPFNTAREAQEWADVNRQDTDAWDVVKVHTKDEYLKDCQDTLESLF